MPNVGLAQLRNSRSLRGLRYIRICLTRNWLSPTEENKVRTEVSKVYHEIVVIGPGPFEQTPDNA